MSERTKRAHEIHKKGFNCCESVVAAFSDRTGLSEQESYNIGGGFGSGAGTGEPCGAVVGAVMALGLLTPVDERVPLGSKKRSMTLAQELQKRFREKFGALRCAELLPKKFTPDDTTPAAMELGLTAHCPIMVVTAVEIVEEMLKEREN